MLVLIAACSDGGVSGVTIWQSNGRCGLMHIRRLESFIEIRWRAQGLTVSRLRDWL